jgi:hypothetical protein
MTSSQPHRPVPNFPSSPPLAGLALRLWIACLGGALVAGGGILWTLRTRVVPGAAADSGSLVVWLAGSATLGLITSAALALWFHARVIGHLKGLTRSVASGHPENLRGLPASSGWGELSELTGHLRLLLESHRGAVRAREELEVLDERLAALARSVEHWSASERWAPLAIESGPFADVARALDRGFARSAEVREQNQEAMRLVRVELSSALTDAQESVEQAERGFVEATALLTTVRELQRLSGELAAALGAGVAPGAPAAIADAWERHRGVTAAAIEELITASTASIEHLGQGVKRVHEIGDQVHLLANRATLIALNAVVATEGARTEDMAEELKTLAREVRGATETTDAMSREIEREITLASQHMKGVRERVAVRLEQIPELPEIGAAPLPDDLVRLHERVREMVQDATRKGERVSAAAERASRSAERFMRRLEEELHEVEGLVVRLGPATAAGARGARGAAEERPRSGPLRLLESEAERGEEGASGAESGDREEHS